MDCYNFRWKDDAPTLHKLSEYLSGCNIPAEGRIAVFDVDGTLVSETDPHYIVALLWLHTVLEDKDWKPSATNRRLAESFRDSIENGTPFECDDYGTLLQVQEERYIGMTPAEYSAYVKAWLGTQPSRLFEPMAEIVTMLKEHGFTVFIVSGSDRDFIRCLMSEALGIPPYHVIGSDVQYDMKGSGVVHGRFMTECDGMEKVVAITREIGRQPVLAFGNSAGDFPMFRYVMHDNPYPAAVYCLLTDDNDKVHGDRERMQATAGICHGEGWNTISMTDEWAGNGN